MDITLKVCDLCEDQNPASESFDIARGRASRHLDLCEKHALPIVDAFNKGSASTASARRRGRGTGSLPVTHLDE